MIRFCVNRSAVPTELITLLSYHYRDSAFMSVLAFLREFCPPTSQATRKDPGNIWPTSYQPSPPSEQFLHHPLLELAGFGELRFDRGDLRIHVEERLCDAILF